ncbi:MAG: YncE family protein [Thermoanaerobaculia bacterium]
MKKLASLLFAVALLGCATKPPATAPHYHVVRHIQVGGEGGWDYPTVDSASHRLFLSHSDRVVVVDTMSGKVVGEIPNTQGVHGIAIASDLHRGFVSCGRTSTVTIFDLDSLKVVSEVKTTGDRPDAITFDPASSRVFTFNAAGKNATAIEAATGAIAATIDLGGKPEFAAADGGGHLFVNIEDTSEVAEIDAAALTVVKRWKLAPCEEPSGLAMDREHRRIFSGCDNKVMAISDANAGRVITTVPIGGGVDGNAYDPILRLAFSANGADGTLTVVREMTADTFDVVETATTQRGARTIALDVATHHVFLPTAQFGPAPAPTTDRPHPRPSIVPGTFEVVELAP